MNFPEFFSQLNSFFDHIYVITLERATDRHHDIRRELNGLEYELFLGKDKRNFSIADLQEQGIYSESLARKNHRYGKAMQEGQIGCAWSHAEVYRDMVEKGYKTALILEDDAVIEQSAAHQLPNILKELPANWGLIYFGYAEREVPPPGNAFKNLFYHFLRLLGVFKYSHKTISHLYPKKISTHISEAGYHDCSHAYGITQDAAKKLLRLQQPVSFIADNLLAHAVTNKIINGYIMLPKLINQQYQLGISSASYLND